VDLGRDGRRGHGTASCEGNEESLTARTLRREVESLRHENTQLLERLGKARGVVTVLQRQTDEARAERDEEQRRSESLRSMAQQLQRQLTREIARASMLERTLSKVSRGEQGGEELDLRSDHDVATNSLDRAGAEERGESARGGVHGVAPSMEKSWEYVVQGQHDSAVQEAFAPKMVSCFPEDAIDRALSRGVACVCSRGRRLDNAVPNQDDLLIARHTLAHDGHIALYGVFDGHGPSGHLCAAFARGALPERLFSQHTLIKRPEETLRMAFRETQEALLQQAFDTVTSGTTAALALVLDIVDLPANRYAPSEETNSVTSNGTNAAVWPADANVRGQSATWLFVAHVGDSRVVLASRNDEDPSAFAATGVTRDHRPHDEEEAERIRQGGGEIRKLHRNSGAVRVFGRGQDRPALALTRTLGASGVLDCGVTAEPEVASYRIRPGVDVLLVLGTDGLFEFCSNEDAVGKVLREGVTTTTLEELCEESRKQWALSSYNETVDDITVIAVALPSAAAGAPTGQIETM